MIARFLTLILVCCGLAGCMANEPGSLTDIHTGTSGHHSQRVSAGSGFLWNLNAVAIAATRGGQTEYGLSTEYMSTGLGWAFLERAWSFGKPLDYSVADRQVLSCSGAGCTQIEKGTITLSAAQFRQAAQTGLEFKLEGKRRSVVGKVGPDVFQQVLALQQGGAG